MLLQDAPAYQEWIKPILLALAVPLFLAVIAAIGYFGKRLFEKRNNTLSEKLKEVELKAKYQEIEQKKNQEIGELGDRLMKTLNLVNELSDELQAKGQTILDNQKIHSEAMEVVEGESAALAARLQDITDAFADSETVIKRRWKAIQAVMSKSGIALWVTDGQGKQVFVSDAFYELFGTTKDSPPNAWKDRLVPGDWERINAEWNRFLSDMETVSAIKFRKICADGAARDCISVYSTVRDTFGEVIEVIGVTTELK